jgi:hypothetical protein
MKNFIFNIGLNKSGTTSLANALTLLGIPTLHYEYNGTEIHQIITKNKKKQRRLLNTLDYKYRAFLDFAGQLYYQDLYMQYPKSKFILTTRPFKDWLTSYIAMTEIASPELLSTPQLQKKTYTNAIYMYYDKTEEIRNFFKDKPNQFIELKICEGDGWKELCNFLNMPIPDVDFPWSNKTIDN